MNYRLLFCLGVVGMGWIYGTDTVKISLSRHEADMLIEVLERIADTTRAPRPNAFTESSPAYPVMALSLAELEAIRAILCRVQSSIGNLSDDGSCFPSIVDVMDIDDAELNVIQWLKTLMREFRGVCPM